MKSAKTVLLLFLCSQPASLFAGDPGSTGFAFLKTGAGARTTAMGGAGAALLGALDSTYLNPATLAAIWQRQALFHYANLYQDVNHSHLEYAEPTLSRGVFAGRLEYLDYGSIPNYDANGAGAGSSNPSDLLLSTSWGSTFADKLSAGATAKYVRESLVPVTGSAFALDLGLAYPISPWMGNRNVTVAMAVRNLGPPAHFEQASQKLPMDFSLGLAYKAFLDRFALALDFHREVDRRELLLINFGGEYWIKDVLALRAGYQTLSDIGLGLSGGFGIKVESFEINYSFSPFSTLGNVHRVGLAYRFGGDLAEKLYQQGLHAAKNGNFAEAILLFDKALTRDPNHPGARKAVKEAYEMMKQNSGPSP